MAPIALSSTPDRSGHGHCRTFAETAAWLEPVLPRVPITRVHNAGALGTVDMPVFIAVTPLARDLTVHAGKGTTAEAARVSAIMEAIERVCGEELPDGAQVRGAYDELSLHHRGAVLDPVEFDLPFDTAYAPDRPITWVWATELNSGEDMLLPADLVTSPPRDGITTGVETNGLASGNTLTEAVLHGLYEVIERDAYSAEVFHLLTHAPGESPPRRVRAIDVAGSHSEPCDWIDALAARGLRVVIQDLTTDLSVTVIMTTIVDCDFPGAEGALVTVAGLGAHLDARHATMRSLTEAVQSHTAALLGARDTFEGLRRVPEREAMLSRRADVLFARPTVRLEELPRHTTRDLRDDVDRLLQRLRVAGHERCLVCDLTRQDLGVPVVRVLVPGLAMPFGDTARRPTRRLLNSILPVVS
jgi:YcaO-like protein with predicted kinase domain